jgi:hypothetical protein
LQKHSVDVAVGTPNRLCKIMEDFGAFHPACDFSHVQIS